MYIVPKLCGVKLHSELLGNIAMVMWNLLGLGAVVTLLNGFTQGREYAELIWPLDVWLVIITGPGRLQYLPHHPGSERKEALRQPMVYHGHHDLAAHALYRGQRDVGAALVIPGNRTWPGFPSGSLTGINDVIWQWFYGHNILGYWFTTSGVAITYYIVPVIIRSPLYSHLLSLIGFWSIAFFYGLVGQHHILQTPTPGWLKTLATLGSLGLFVPVFSFLANIWLTMRGKWGKIYESLPLKFMIVGTIFYFITCVQGPFQSIQGFNRLIHFTNWIVGHAHLALLGTFSFWLMGAIYYIVPVTLRRRIYSPGMAEVQFWLVTFGFLLMMLSLQIGGLIQGAAWMQGATVPATVPMLKPYFIIRAISGALIVLSGIVQAWNIYKTVTAGERIVAGAPGGRRSARRGGSPGVKA